MFLQTNHKEDKQKQRNNLKIYDRTKSLPLTGCKWSKFLSKTQRLAMWI